jgi:hypothetical protein
MMPSITAAVCFELRTINRPRSTRPPLDGPVNPPPILIIGNILIGAFDPKAASGWNPNCFDKA